MRRPLALAGLVTVAALTLAACSGTTNGSSSGGGDGEVTQGAGFDGETIKVGILNPTSGPLGAGAGLPVLEGIQLRVDRINSQGGIAGEYPIELTVGDTEYNPQVALTAYNSMVGDITMVGSILGTGVVNALLPELAADDTLAFPLTDDAAFARNPNLMSIRPTYQVSFINGLLWMYEQDGGEDLNYCMLRQDDASGEAYHGGVVYGLDSIGVTLAEDVTFPNDTTDFTGQVQRLSRADCDVVALGAAAPFAQGIIAASVQLDFTPKWVTLMSGVPLFLMGSPSEDYIAEHFIVSGVGTAWGDLAVPGMAELVADYEEFGDPTKEPDASLWQVGYAYAIAMETLLEEAVNRGEISPAALLDISHTDGFTVDTGGLTPTATFGDPAKRQPPTETVIFGIDPAVQGFLSVIDSGFDTDAAKSFQDYYSG